MKIIVILGCQRGFDQRSKNQKDKITKKTHLYYRLEKGFEVYNNIEDKAKMIICSGGFGVSLLMKQYLIEKGIAENLIIVDNKSRNTIENAIESYRIIKYWIESRPIMSYFDKSYEINQYDMNNVMPDFEIDCSNLEIFLVTNEYHIERSTIIYKHFVKFMKPRIKIIKCGAKLPDDVEDEKTRNNWKCIESKIIQHHLKKQLSSIK